MLQESFALIYILAAITCALIITISIVFIVKAFRRAEAIGMDKKVLINTVKNSAVFSIVPSIPIVIGVGIVMSYLGLAVAWIRMSVIGALQYEMLAMTQVIPPTAEITPSLIATAIVVMTVAILSGPVFNALFYKKYQNKLASLQQKNAKLMDTVTGSLLCGLLAGILSAIIVGAFFSISEPLDPAAVIPSYGGVTLITLGASIVVMAVCGVLLVKFKQKWIESYALPMSILGAMTAAFIAVPFFGG
jgi:hypothetical protein